MKRLFVPIRIKFTIALLLVTTAVVSVITFTMANLFHRDKQAYINDLAAIVALNAAEETRALLLGYGERLQACALILGRTDVTQSQKSELLNEFFRDVPALVAVALYENGKEGASAYDAGKLNAAGLSRHDIQKYRRKVALPMERIAAGEVFVENSTLSERLPALTLALAHRIAGRTRPAIVTGIIRLDSLLRLSSRSGVFEVFVVDRSGTLLAHPDAGRVARRDSIALPGMTVRIDRTGGSTQFSPKLFRRRYSVLSDKPSALAVCCLSF